MNFDNASTTRPLAAVIEESNRINTELYANPASLHSQGVLAETRITSATKTLAGILGVGADEIVYTSGGTESNNLAIFGVCEAMGRKARHVITTKSEHPSVAETCRHLERRGFEVTWLKIDTNGAIDLDELAAAVRDDTVLVSLMHVNNETGVVCDIAGAARAVKAKNRSVVFHSDGVQAFGKLKPVLSGIDLYSMSAHKIHGLRGVGGLYVRKGVRISPQIYGGGQQRGLRSGTENTAGICTFALAAERAYGALDASYAHTARLREHLAGITEELSDVFINGDGSPYILNMSFLGVRAEVLLHCLERDGMYVSTGSACGSKGRHNILGYYGLSKERVESALRFSFSGQNTRDEVERLRSALVTHVNELRERHKR